MKKSEILQKIAEVGIIPVVRAESAATAMQAIDAIRQGGIPILEVTMTVPGAIKVIEQIVEKYGDNSLIGAGTVLNAETARACIAAGAQFIVAPGTDIATIGSCNRLDIPVMPGALTPTEVITAWEAGADCVKVFPCGAVGGASYIRALKAPLPHIQLVPTGGVSVKTAADFIKAGALALGVGADLVDLKALREGRAEAITERAMEYVQIVKEARGRG